MEKAYELVQVEGLDIQLGATLHAGRGLGARASRDLRLGDVVLLERPIIAIADDGRGDEWKVELKRQCSTGCLHGA